MEKSKEQVQQDNLRLEYQSRINIQRKQRNSNKTEGSTDKIKELEPVQQIEEEKCSQQNQKNNFHQNGDENTNKKRKQDPFIQSLDDEEEGTNNNLQQSPKKYIKINNQTRIEKPIIQKFKNAVKNIVNKNKKSQNLRKTLQNVVYQAIIQNKEPKSECSVCYQNQYPVKAITTCGHTFCADCLIDWSNVCEQTCPLDRQKLNQVMLIDKSDLTLPKLHLCISKIQTPMTCLCRAETVNYCKNCEINLCANCGLCYLCNNKTCNLCINICETCEKSLCLQNSNQCYVNCSECDDKICKNCILKCSEPNCKNHKICKQCLTVCSQCKNPFCALCNQQCSICDELICTHCTKENQNRANLCVTCTSFICQGCTSTFSEDHKPFQVEKKCQKQIHDLCKECSTCSCGAEGCQQCDMDKCSCCDKKVCEKCKVPCEFENCKFNNCKSEYCNSHCDKCKMKFCYQHICHNCNLRYCPKCEESELKLIECCSNKICSKCKFSCEKCKKEVCHERKCSFLCHHCFKIFCAKEENKNCQECKSEICSDCFQEIQTRQQNQNNKDILCKECTVDINIISNDKTKQYFCKLCNKILSFEQPYYHSIFEEAELCKECGDFEDKTQKKFGERYKYHHNMIFVNLHENTIEKLNFFSKNVRWSLLGDDLQPGLEEIVNQQENKFKCDSCQLVDQEEIRWVCLNCRPIDKDFCRDTIDICNTCHNISSDSQNKNYEQIHYNFSSIGHKPEHLMLKVLTSTGNYYEY